MGPLKIKPTKTMYLAVLARLVVNNNMLSFRNNNNNNNNNTVSIFVKRHKVVTSEALAADGCVCYS